MTEKYKNDPRRLINRVGETMTNNEGCEMKIIEYTNANNITVEFQDIGKFIVKTTYRMFKDGTIKNWGKHLYEERKNKYGLNMKIVQYNGSNNIMVEFDDGYTIKTTYQNFKDGYVRHPTNNEIYNQRQSRVGEIKKNFQGDEMKIIKYNNRNSIIIQFLDNYMYETNTVYNTFLNGTINNPYHPTLCNIEIIGKKYQIQNENGQVKEYSTWAEMIKRCYSDRIHEIRPTYIDCTVCKEWLLYENFYEWLHNQENFDTWIQTPLSALDKDILIKHNKLYSPDTCCLVPVEVNSLFSRNESHRGNLPIGVSFHKATNKYQAQCNDGSNNISLGVYDTPEEAFLVYKKYKEGFIKQMARENFINGRISKKCFDSMMNYIVEIGD